MISTAAGFVSCSGDDDNANTDPTICPSSNSPYITNVFEYQPAPGQFVNALPKYEAGDTKETMRQKAEQAITYNKREVISLGGFGGYVVFGFDHKVQNIEGKKDFRILGNAFRNNSEPGIIMVSYDANGNGLPDDEWYEITGSEYVNSEKGYEITYFRPNPNKTPVPDAENPSIADKEYIKWEDNKGNSGYLQKLQGLNSGHAKNYFPQWLSGDNLTFKGTKLPNNGQDNGAVSSETGKWEPLWQLKSYDFGYADNLPNNDDGSAIDIAWAVDKNGKKVNLDGIQFVKVYTGVNQQCGLLGETSTEIVGAEDLHCVR